MAKLLTILTLILVILLFPPAALALISNNAVPGDVTYPIKRGLEDVIFSIASVHPVTKAWFSAARSDRRFQEISILATQGKQSDKTLNELVEQTQVAADQIAQISDQTQKAQFVEKLSESIKKYDKGLAQLSPQVVQPTPAPAESDSAPGATAIPTPIPTVAPTLHPTTAPTIKPISTPPTRVTPGPIATPMPTTTAHPTPTPQATPTPISPPPTSKCDEIKEPIEKARCKLESIRVGLGAHSQDAPRQENRGDGKDENRGRGKDQKDEDKQDNKDNREDDNGNRGKESSKRDKD